MSLFLHFSITFIHQTLQFYSSLYSEGFYWGVCSYFIHVDLYNILFLKTRQKCIYLKAMSLFLHFSSTYKHQNLQFYSSLYSEGFLLRGLFIFHSRGFIQHFIPKNTAKMHIFKGYEFVSPLQQHLQTPSFTVLFLSIFWRILLRGLFIFHSRGFIQHFIPKNTAKMHIFKGYEFVSPLQQHLQTPKLTVLFLSIFWRFLLRGLFIFHSHWFIQHLWPWSTKPVISVNFSKLRVIHHLKAE